MDFINYNRYSPFASPDDIQNPWQGVNFAPPEGVDASGAASESSNGISPQSNTMQPMSIADRMKVLNEVGPAAKALQAHLETLPQNKPNALTRIAASAAGFGAGWRRPDEGALVGQQVLNAPYNQKVNDWMVQGKALENAAGIEDRGYRAKVALLSNLDRAEKEMYTEGRNAVNDPIRNQRLQAETKNYDSLVQARGQGYSFHKNATDGHLIGIKKDGTTQDFGVMDLTPQQQADLKVNTFGREENLREQGQENLFRVKSPIIGQREKDVHSANRDYDVAHPLPSRTAGAREVFVSVQQQTGAIKQAAKELQIENPDSKYSRFMNTDGTLKTPDELGGTFSSASDDDVEALKQFYNKVKERADQITSKTRKPRTESTAVAGPKVKDPRIQD